MKAIDLFDLKGRTALVTGASSGLGQQFVRALADNGAAVTLVARRADRLEAHHGRAVGDIGLNGDGTATFALDLLLQRTPVEWHKVLGIDLDAVFHNAQEASRRMLTAGKKGSIVNISSVLGLGAAKGTAAYGAAKAAVIQTTKAMAAELAFKGVRVNAIAPGWFVTEINEKYLMSEAGVAIKRDIPMGRFGNEGDLDGALLLLASDAGAYITGATIVVDGGQVIQLNR